jgi:phage terminase Nu1 subunit (DNA packaging protein)
MADKQPKFSLAAFQQVRVGPEILASFLDVDARSISNFAKEELVVKAGRGEYLLLESVRRVSRRRAEQAAGRLGKDPDVDPARANAMFKNKQSELTQIKIDELQGRLISLPELEAAWSEIMMTVKQAFLSIATRARARMPHLTANDQIDLDGVVRDVMSEIPDLADGKNKNAAKKPPPASQGRGRNGRNRPRVH